MHSLESPFAQLDLDLGRACWSFVSQRAGDLGLEGARMRVAYRCGRAKRQALGDWRGGEVGPVEVRSSLHGPLHCLSLQLGPDPCGLRCRLELALPETCAALFWRLSIENQRAQPVFLDRLTLLEVTPQREPGYPSRITNLAHDTARFFSNGWQSWSYAGAYGPADRFCRTRLGPVREPTDVNAGTPMPAQKGCLSSDMFGVLGDRGARRGLLAGFLSQEQHFGSLEARLGLGGAGLSLWANGDGARLDPGRQIETDWACLYSLDADDPDPLGPYLEAVGRQAGLADKPQAAIPTGWCSWYQFSSETYTGAVSAQDIRDNLGALAALKDDLPLSILQIDDGFEAQIGDWFDFKPGFPQGVAPLAAEIRRAGFTPGLWLAPFIVHPGSRLAAEHPDWLLRGSFNRPVNAGLLWDTFTTALDLTQPRALDYARQVVQTAVHAWGYPYLKLDFLYAAALPGKHMDPTRTRAQVLRSGLAALRQAAGEQAFLLGCGCPLGPAIGLVDAMRVSADTARRWKPSFRGVEAFIAPEPNLPAARNACHNSLTRSPLHRRWWFNDPDCLLARPGTHLTPAEVQTVATVIALSGGSVFASDHLPDLPEERLRILQGLLPPIGRRPRTLDWLEAATPTRLRLDLEGAAGPWHLLARFNWEDAAHDTTVLPEDFGLDPQTTYWAREFWRGETHLLAGSGWTFPACPPHSVLLLAARPRLPDQPQYLGSDLHISQGLEVGSWRWDSAAGELTFCLRRPGRTRGVVDLALPGTIQSASLNGQALDWQRLEEGVYRLGMAFKGEAEIRVRL
jgi:alpha-galactosidase